MLLLSSCWPAPVPQLPVSRPPRHHDTHSPTSDGPPPRVPLPLVMPSLFLLPPFTPSPLPPHIPPPIPPTHPPSPSPPLSPARTPLALPKLLPSVPCSCTLHAWLILTLGPAWSSLPIFTSPRTRVSHPYSRVLAASPSPLDAPLPPSMHRDLGTTVPHELRSRSTSLRCRCSRTPLTTPTFRCQEFPHALSFTAVLRSCLLHTTSPRLALIPIPSLSFFLLAPPPCTARASPLPFLPSRASRLSSPHITPPFLPLAARVSSLTLREYLHTLILILILILLHTSSSAPAQFVSLRVSSLLFPAHRFPPRELRNTKRARATRDSASAPRYHLALPRFLIPVPSLRTSESPPSVILTKSSFLPYLPSSSSPPRIARSFSF
ncbi:hypothetical protein C8R44DRAFT_881778 [Mycena epipterygia]|nr:hypothetical protein C8R44DRAFT_881778 [Mycena epipterygia]